MKRIRILLMGFALGTSALAGAVSSALAQVPAGMELGPKVGAKAPAFSLISSSGETGTFETLKGRRGVVLVFVRSADW